MAGFDECLLLVLSSAQPHRSSMYKRDLANVRDRHAHSIFINSLSCVLTGQSAALLRESVFLMSTEEQRISSDVKSIILKKKQPIIHDMKRYTKTSTAMKNCLSSHSFFPQHHVSDFRANVVALNGITELRMHAFHF